MKTKKIKSFNNWLAIRITNGTATMYCAYFFAVLAVIGFPYDAITARNIVQWLSQTFIQLTMLSIISVAQKLQSNKSDDHIEKTLKHISSDNDRLLQEVGVLLKNKSTDNHFNKGDKK